MANATVTRHGVDVDAAARELAGADATQVVRWAVDTFGDGLVMTSSFGAQAAVMLHLVTRVVPNIPVIFIDTGYLFPETYRFAEELTQRLRLNLKVYQPVLSAARYEALHGRQWEMGEQGLVEYNQMRKVEPMQRALRDLGAKAWLAGLRRQQTDYRASLRVVEFQDGIYKVYPILEWTTRDVHEYLKKHDLPYHPLYEKGYRSIGDTHSTEPTFGRTPERAGRFGGLQQECGLHMDLHIPESREEDQSRASSDL